MDAQTAVPPVRIHAVSSTPISTEETQARLDQFLADFQNRSTASKGGDTTVTVQLQKLNEALTAEHQSS
ncbi:hypothetical protein GLOTRDRAFT_99501 [Gloeophyllum trabeum ATCC 11539]|uniref:Uncharacterized protein n=1 Tax=Gloeophyllum trabeum (strain ATCC 11539 / FP-39264 / Madison 617) TaxID=670483 RepID=S7Q9T5_GLOTA|nr:uncharacterized protein GLOTRDRAFT_99501 [Gloeophyllum trabeum ATCC 11539]EPQ56103.1 hypothetical protein GLOTRDRAFT_99501 [Gloeophyllum trabeum ATCC 11539]